MNLEQPQAEQKRPKNIHVEVRNRLREGATELQRGAAEIQGARYEAALYCLMNRTGNNHELVNSMSRFVEALNRRAMYGREGEPLDRASVEKLTAFFDSKSKELEELVGERSAK